MLDENPNHIVDIQTKLDGFEFLFNSNVDKYKSLAIAYKPHIDVALTPESHRSGMSLISVRKMTFRDKPFLLLLLYRSHSSTLTAFLDQLSCVISTNREIDFILGDFNVDSVINRQLSIWMEVILNRISSSKLVKCIHFSDHDAVKIRITTRVEDESV